MREDARQEDISALLAAWSEGNQNALERLTPIVYDELRRLARHYMKESVPATACKQRRWSTKHIRAWWTTNACSGRIALTSSLLRRN